MSRSRGAAIVLLIAGSAIAWLVPVLFGTPRPMILVTWREIGTLARAQLEHRFQLSEPRAMNGHSWSYVPLDTSAGTLRAIARHEAVAATDGINRSSFRISSNPPLSERRGGVLVRAPRVAARIAKLAAFAFLFFGVFILLGPRLAQAVIVRSTRRCARTDNEMRPGTLAASLARGIPAASAEAAAAFRIVFATLVLSYVWSEPADPALLGAYEVGATRGPYGAIIHALASWPVLVAALPFGCGVTGVAVIAGLFTRASFAAFTACVILWASVVTLGTTSHAVAALQVTMVCLLAARWGDAWSIDAWLRTRRGRCARPCAGTGVTYGFPMWAPVLVLGITFAAASWAKLQKGPAWILNGTVKYHFVSDLEYAWVEWGVRLTQSHVVAVLLSAAAVTIEALVLTAALTRSDRYRTAIGLGALALLGGFALFQGVMWPGWWILLIGFLPWHRIVRPADDAAQTRPSLSFVELAIVLCVIAQQVYASMAHVEARPLFSAYDMYSATYDSPESYEEATNLVYRVVAIRDDEATELPGCVIDDAAVRVVEAAVHEGGTPRDRVRALLRPCIRDYPEIKALRFEGDRQVYNWQMRRFEWRRQLDVIGPVPVDWLRD